MKASRLCLPSPGMLPSSGPNGVLWEILPPAGQESDLEQQLRFIGLPLQTRKQWKQSGRPILGLKDLGR